MYRQKCRKTSENPNSAHTLRRKKCPNRTVRPIRSYASSSGRQRPPNAVTDDLAAAENGARKARPTRKYAAGML